MKNGKNIKKMVIGALFTALVCVATIVIKYPIPIGYLNLGDCIVLLSAWMMGPFIGAFAAGVGSMLADILVGYPSYALGTLVIKALMALSAGFVLRFCKSSFKTAKLWQLLISGVIAELIMVFGYFGYEAVILSYGLAAGANIPLNLIQGAVGIVAGLAVLKLTVKLDLIKGDV